LYRIFVSNCFAEALTYRLHFVLLMAMDILFYLSVLGSVDFLFAHLDHIGPWGRTDFMFFMAFMLAVEHLHMTFVSENFWTFSYDIRMGQLDFILLKPVGALFVVFFRSMRPATLLNAVFPWFWLVHFGTQLDLGWAQWALLPLLVLLALALQVSIEILMSLSMFWIVESMGVNFLRMQLQQLSRWPDFVYRYVAQKFFSFVVPVLLIGSAPVKFLRDPHQWQGMVWLLFLMGVSWVLIGYFWRKGLRAYESASS
jgi:ABC-2 type transport system permease protein